MSGRQMFDDWLMSTRVLQRLSYGADPATLSNQELENYLMWNHTALIKELGEALDEVDWKPWTTTHDGFYNRDAFVGEMVDVLHFAANMLVAANCSDVELSRLYRAKQEKNRQRMASGTYTGVKDKCPQCHRSYDDDAVKCQKVDDKKWYCADPSIGGNIEGYIEGA